MCKILGADWKKMPSYQYRKSHYADKTILQPSYLHNGVSFTGKMASFYWIRAQVVDVFREQYHMHDQLVVWIVEVKIVESLQWTTCDMNSWICEVQAVKISFRE